MVKYRIRPYWYTERVSDMAKNPMAVEQWIKSLMTTPRKKDEKPRPLAPKTKGHTKAVFHRLFECAMRWRYLEVQRNPNVADRAARIVEEDAQDRPRHH